MTRRRVLLVLAVAVVGGLAWLWTRPSELSRVRAELDAADPGWRFAEVYAARLADQPPPADNVVLEAVLAAGLIPREYHDWQAATDAPPRRPDNRKPPDVPAWRAAAPAVAAGRRLVELPRGMADVTVPADPFQVRLPHYDPCHQLARLLAVDAVQSAAAGDGAGAVASVRAVLGVARGLGREPWLMGYLGEAGHRQRAADALLGALAQAELPADGLAAVEGELPAAPGAWADAVRNWRAMSDLELTAVAAGAVDLQFASQLVVAGGTRTPPNQTARWRYRLLVGHDHAAHLRRMTTLVEVARRPPHEWVAAEAAMPLPPDDDRHLFGHAEAVIARKQFAGAVRHLAVQRTAAVAVGCERFRMQHGRWPESLAELPPGDFADPYTGGPLELKRLPDGLAVYSVGPDGTDDGGTFSPAPAAPKSDVGFRLWDVSARGVR